MSGSERETEFLIKKDSIEAFDWLVKGEVGSLSIPLNKNIFNIIAIELFLLFSCVFLFPNMTIIVVRNFSSIN